MKANDRCVYFSVRLGGGETKLAIGDNGNNAHNIVLFRWTTAPTKCCKQRKLNFEDARNRANGR